MERVLVPLAAGAEEMETVTIVDVLRRAGVEVVVAGLAGPDPVVCSRGVRIVPDAALAEASGPFDLVVLPGGTQAAEALAASLEVQRILQEQHRAGRLVGAICAAPLALAAAGVGRDRSLTSHPSIKDRLGGFGRYSEERVVADGNLVTSRGPGTALEFSLALVERLLGPEAARSVAEPMLAPAP